MFRRVAITGILMSLLAISAAAFDAVKPIKEWKGSVKDESLLGNPPSFITSQAELNQLWKAWKLKGRPTVDFKKQVVVLVTSRGSGLSLVTNLDDQGNLQVDGLGTMDFRPGFRYVIAAMDTKGIKSINGKPLTSQAGQATVTGTVSFRQRIALTTNATLEVSLVDVSLADAPAVVLATQEIKPTTQVPIPYSLNYDSAKIDSKHSYAVQAKIMLDGKLWFTSTKRYAVITQGNPNKIAVLVEMVKSPQ